MRLGFVWELARLRGLRVTGGFSGERLAFHLARDDFGPLALAPWLNEFEDKLVAWLEALGRLIRWYAFVRDDVDVSENTTWLCRSSRRWSSKTRVRAFDSSPLGPSGFTFGFGDGSGWRWAGGGILLELRVGLLVEASFSWPSRFCLPEIRPGRASLRRRTASAVVWVAFPLPIFLAASLRMLSIPMITEKLSDGGLPRKALPRGIPGNLAVGKRSV